VAPLKQKKKSKNTIKIKTYTSNLMITYRKTKALIEYLRDNTQ